MRYSPIDIDMTNIRNSDGTLPGEQILNTVEEDKRRDLVHILDREGELLIEKTFTSGKPSAFQSE